MAITEGTGSIPPQRERRRAKTLDPIVPSMPSRDLGWTKWAGDDLDGAATCAEMTIIRGVD